MLENEASNPIFATVIYFDPGGILSLLRDEKTTNRPILKPQVLIVEASAPEDFYDQALDGVAVHNLLNTIGVTNELHMAITPKYLEEAIRKATRGEFNILHLACHGDDNGISVGPRSPNHRLSWSEFVGFFQDLDGNLPALVMSTCCGAASGIGNAFSELRDRPPFIFGSTEDLGYGEYVTAWAILYHRLNRHGVSRDTAQIAMEQISAVVDNSFIYRRWSNSQKSYRKWPPSDSLYQVIDVKDEEQVRTVLARHPQLVQR